MPPDQRRLLDETFAETLRLHEQVRDEAREVILEAAATVSSCLRRGGKVLVFGNGGSAADSQHFAAELVGRFTRERQALAAVALTTDTSILTAIGNDYGFERVFSRQVEALGRTGDVALGITTSGESANVLAAFDSARARGLVTIALTGGGGGRAGKAADLHLNAPGPTARAQEVHRTVLHVLCDLVERDLAQGGSAS